MSTARLGRAGSFALGLIVGFLLLGYAALRAFELAPRSPPATAAPAGGPEPQAVGSWRATVELDGARVTALLLPLHDEPALEEFRAEALRARYGLPAGRPWRLYLALAEPAPAPVVVRAARVGTALVPFAELAAALEGPDPVHALLAAAPGALLVERARPMVLWGEMPDGASELALASDAGAGAGALVLDEGVVAPRWYAGQALPPVDTRSLEEEVARLEQELDRERTRRAEREQTFLEFSRLVAELPAGRELGLVPPERVDPPPTPEQEALRAAAEAARARATELGRSLSVLMRVEGLRGLDLLEAGTLQEGPVSAIGPVVFRCLDERGGLAGSVHAERLRLEASVAAHTLTLVLEDGYESRGGERAPFRDGVRRITLTDVDPAPWIVECPELFDAGDRAAHDDGLWSLGSVRRELNRLLALDTRMGWYRLHSLGGVRGTELVDVQLEELEASGKLLRRLFADRLVLALEDGSVVLELRDGAFVRGGEKQPFRDGRHRIVLAGVPLVEWRAAALPGLGDPPAREKPAEDGRPGG